MASKILLEAIQKNDAVSLKESMPYWSSLYEDQYAKQMALYANIDTTFYCETMLRRSIAYHSAIHLAVIHRQEDDQVLQHILATFPHVSFCFFKYITPKQLSVELLQKCCRLGISFYTISKVLPKVVKELIKINDTCISNKSQQQKQKLQHDKQRLFRVLKYVLVHNEGYHDNVFRTSAILANQAGAKQLAMLFADHMNDFDFDYVQRKVGSCPPPFNAKALKCFVNRETREGGKIDQLLYKPPSGLMVKKSLRELF